MLKIARPRFSHISDAAKLATTPTGSKAHSPASRNAAIARLTAGPASVTSSSTPGLRGIRARLATPPIGYSVIPEVPIPWRRASKAWPNSCSSTQPNRAKTIRTPNTPPPVRAM